MGKITDNKIIRYLFSGGTATFVNLSTIYILTDVFGVWYIFSSVVSFCTSLIVSFFMQKYITFKDGSEERTKDQFTLYFLVALINLSLNTLMIYSLVEFTGLYYLYSQILSSLLIATESFFVYNFFIFKKEANPIVENDK